MDYKNVGYYFFLVVLLGVFVATFFVFKPFIYPLILAVVFVTIFEPMHRRVQKMMFGRRSLAAFISTILVLIVIIIPLAFLSFQILKEVSVLYASFAAHNGTGDLFASANETLQRLINHSPIPVDFTADVDRYLKDGLTWLLEHLGQIFLNVAQLAMETFIFLIALYYLFKDGHRLKKAVVIFSPLRDEHDETILSKLALAIKSVVGGNIVVALVQGCLTAVGFAIFGVPNPVLWGSVAAIASLVPTLGTSLVIVPAILYMLWTGHILPAFGLGIWGLFAVGLVDNFLGPKLVGRGMKIHPLLILLAVLGGITLFGPLGFILGPLIMSLFGALIEIYFSIRKEKSGY